MSTLQLRRRQAVKEKIRAAEDGAEGVVTAYVSVFDVEYRVGPFGQREIIRPGAFDESIEDKPVVPFAWSHNWPFGLMIGDAALSADEHGLIAEATLDLDDELGRRVFRRIASGAIDEFSIGYIPTAFEVDPDDEDLEIVTTAQCIEASAVVLGANPDTEVIDVRNRQLLAPVFAPRSDGVLEVSWVPAQAKDDDEESTTTPDEKPSLDADELAEAIVARLREREPALADDPALAEHLSEPWFRELVRERLSSTVTTSE